MGNYDIQGKALGRSVPALKGSQSPSAADFAVFQSITTLDTYLLTQGYTQARLDTMTKNDKVYAARTKRGANTTPH